MPSAIGKSTVLLDIKDWEPLNAEPDLASLVQFPHTPDDLLYSRNHCPIKVLDADTFKLSIDGAVEKRIEYTLSDFKRAFPSRVEVVAALQCAGNRRKTMADTKHKDVEGIKWGEATVANIRFTGVPLRDVLLSAGLQYQDDPDAISKLHVCFASHVSECQEDSWFGASIPLEKALDEEGGVIVAIGMNGHPLTPAHGFPFRMVVPGYSGVRWVKWLDHITVSTTESSNFYQQRDYKILPPQVTSHEQANSEAWWSRLPPLNANPLNSVIATARVIPRATGYAIPSDSGQITSVCISCNKGRTWKPAKITYQEGKWSWTLWEAVVTVDVADLLAHHANADDDGNGNAKSGKELHELVLWSRAEDESGRKQDVECEWNLRGVGYAGVGEYEVDL